MTTDQSLSGIIVYDTDCQVCSLAIHIASQHESIGALDIREEVVQQFLSKHVDTVPFVLIFVDLESEQIHLGADAASLVSEIAGMPATITARINTHYHDIASILPRQGSEPVDAVDGSIPLTDTSEVDALIEVATSSQKTGQRRK